MKPIIMDDPDLLSSPECPTHFGRKENHMNIVESNKTYIHYSDTKRQKYDPELFKAVSNEPFRNKPNGGLWASVDSPDVFGWKDWCEAQDFRICDELYSFKFKLKPGNRVLTLRSLDDADGMPCINGRFSFIGWAYPDFEKLRDEYDVDAIEIEDISAWYDALYGWDCECILVLNPDAIEEVTDGERRSVEQGN